jgi:hypothetical protein
LSGKAAAASSEDLSLGRTASAPAERRIEQSIASPEKLEMMEMMEIA